MATVTAYTAERMKEIEDSCIVDGAVVLDNLILTKHDGTEIDAGNVRGPTGSPGVSNAELDAWMTDNLPICTIVDYLGTVPPSAKWLAMAGQTVANADTLYPAWWAKLPAGMKSGTNALMPNTKGRVSVGYDSAQAEFNTIGLIGGEKQHVLTKAELPASTVAVDPPATNVYIDPPNTAFSGTALNGGPPPHVHSPYDSTGEFVCQRRDGGPHAIMINAGTGATVFSSPNTSQAYLDHSHPVSGTVDIAPFWATCDIPAFNSGALGSGAGHNILQLYIVTLKMIKVL
jgi:hypothetical protein